MAQYLTAQDVIQIGRTKMDIYRLNEHRKTMQEEILGLRAELRALYIIVTEKLSALEEKPKKSARVQSKKD